MHFVKRAIVIIAVVRTTTLMKIEVSGKNTHNNRNPNNNSNGSSRKVAIIHVQARVVTLPTILAVTVTQTIIAKVRGVDNP